MDCEKILTELGEFCNQIDIYFTRRMWYSGQVLCRPDLAFEARPAARAPPVTSWRQTMKRLFRKTLALSLALTMILSLGVSAAASDAMGEDLTALDTLLHQETQLSTNTFWSTAYNDMRTENLITYTPNLDVTPIVTYGQVLTDRNSVTGTARELESQGYRVVAGINGDFYNVNTGLPIGLVVTEGQLRSGDGGYYAIGFRADGTAVIGKPGVKVTASLGYFGADGTEATRSLTAVNKARVSENGIHLYTYDFNAKHTTGNTEAGVDVLCTIQAGRLSIGETVTAVVERVEETTSATVMGPGQIVLSANLKSDASHVDALRSIPVGATITLAATAASEEWNDVEYAVGALYSLVSDGAVVAGLPTGVNPRTAVGVRHDGSVIFYTIDGRRAGHSVGASMDQVAKRMIELGCYAALCLDGGGSTTLSVTAPDKLESATANRPSDGAERKVSNQVFLVASNQPTGVLSHFYVQADNQYVLAGSKVNISASAVDTSFIPMQEDYRLSTDGGDLDGNVLTTPLSGGDVTVTAGSGRSSGSTTVHAVTTPDALAIRSADGTALTTLGAAPGTVTQLTATAAYQHKQLKADPEAFTWSVEGSIGTIDALGNFTAGLPGEGLITVSAGGRSTSIQVTVSNLSILPVEDFEEEAAILDGIYGEGLQFSRSTAPETVRLGRGSGRLDYTLTEEHRAHWRAFLNTPVNRQLYTSLNLWVCGDGSNNVLALLYTDGVEELQVLPVTTLDFTGWKQVSVAMPQTDFSIQGLQISAGEPVYTYDEATGTETVTYPETAHSGTVYIDHIAASFDNTVDTTVPTVTARVSGTSLTGTVKDDVDGVLSQTSVSVLYDGEPLAFTYDGKTGTVSAALPTADGAAHRVTITARDGSGNIGRASADIAAQAEERRFRDTAEYWGADFCDYLYDHNISRGYTDGTFRPNQLLTRLDFSVMLYNSLNLDPAKYTDVSVPFADLSKISQAALPAVRALYAEGIVTGTQGKDGKLYLNPDGNLTRAQASAMIGRSQDKGYAMTGLTFTDAGKIPSYATFYIQTMAAQGIISGYEDNTFRPNNNITRGQMAKILYNLR